MSPALARTSQHRINFFYKFGRPTHRVKTASSSSLEAINMACNSMWSAECGTALAGGMNIATGSDKYKDLSSSASHFLFEIGGCKTFRAAADRIIEGKR